MSLSAVLKIGGSLARGSELPALCREISVLGESHSLLIVPGGWVFADQVRNAGFRFALGDTAAHCMALLAMNQYGYILNHLIAGSSLGADLDSALDSAESGHPAVLLPSDLLIREDPLPHSWQVTSDSIAAWIANRTGCQRLVLLKDVDGLLHNGSLIGDMQPGDLAQHSGGVDEYLSTLLPSVRVETWIINGGHPERLRELLHEGRATGTRIDESRAAACV